MEDSGSHCSAAKLTHALASVHSLLCGLPTWSIRRVTNLGRVYIRVQVQEEVLRHGGRRLLAARGVEGG